MMSIIRMAPEEERRRRRESAEMDAITHARKPRTRLCRSICTTEKFCNSVCTTAL